MYQGKITTSQISLPMSEHHYFVAWSLSTSVCDLKCHSPPPNHEKVNLYNEDSL